MMRRCAQAGWAKNDSIEPKMARFSHFFQWVMRNRVKNGPIRGEKKRITRKVYLLRPKHLGGIRIMDWDKTEVLIDKNMSDLEGTGGDVILVWDKGDGMDLQGTPTDNLEVIFVGKPTHNASELLAFWEYIRRYMEDGPAVAPAPKKLLSKFPWPWLSLKAAWGLDTGFLRHRALWVFVVANLLMLPAILIHATGHWLSLLLCYEPRFPRAIEEAGR